MLSLTAASKPHTIADTTTEISIRGLWVRVPALHVNGKTIITRGKWIRVAVIQDEEWLDGEVEAPELCLKTLRENNSNGLHADVFCFAQKPPETVPRYRYPMEWDSIAAVRTCSVKNWWEKLPQETRKNVRRSQKRGVVVEIRELDDSLIRGIVGVNNDSPMRQRLPNAHYGKTLDQIKKDQSSFLDRCDFICAYWGDELIGFLKLVYRGEVASILQLLPKASHQDKRPANALIAKAVEACERKGVSYLTYGMFNYGNKHDSPLREFKVRNGFEEMRVPRFYIPLTNWGRIWVSLKLHRGLIGILPHSAITLGVNARAKWYSLQQSMSRCSSMPEQPNRTRQMGRSNPPAGSNFDSHQE